MQIGNPLQNEEIDEETRRLIAEREEIMRQLAELSDEDDDADQSSDQNMQEIKQEDSPAAEELENVIKQERPITPEMMENSYKSVKIPSDSRCPYSQIEETEVDDLLEADLGNDESINRSQDESGELGTPPDKVWKFVPDGPEGDRNNIKLPEGWAVITHNSGMIMYYHKFSKCITHSKPYRVEGPVRAHSIPISALPCLQRKANIKKELDSLNSTLVKDEPMDDYEEVKKEVEEETIDPDRFREYCSSIFKFKKILVSRFDCSEAKIEAIKDRKVNMILKRAGFKESYEELKSMKGDGDLLISAPSGAILIDITPIEEYRRTGNRKPFLLNPLGKTTVSVLSEFMQRLVKGKLEYTCEDNRNVSCPYKATAWVTMKTEALQKVAGFCKEKLNLLKGMAEMSEVPGAVNLENDMKRFPIGRGVGSSKKIARLSAAKEALLKLLPNLKISDDHNCEGFNEVSTKPNVLDLDETAMELMDKVKIDAKNLIQVCVTSQMTKPHNLLKDAVGRSIRWNGMHMEVKKDFIGNGGQQSRVTIKLGDMEQTAEGIGFKNAQHMASQLLLKQMHPELDSYGSLLRLYSRNTDKALIENAKKQHDEVVRLQDRGNMLQPNHAVLGKLREEMLKVSLVHPPRKFLYGMAPENSGEYTEQISKSTQTNLDDMYSACTPQQSQSNRQYIPYQVPTNTPTTNTIVPPVLTSPGLIDVYRVPPNGYSPASSRYRSFADPSGTPSRKRPFPHNSPSHLNM